MGSKTHVKNAIRVVEALITEGNAEAKLKLTARNPFPSGYKPELDVTPELNNKLGLRFLQLIGILRWAGELGRLDIFVKVLQLSQHQALSRRGHLEALYHIFAYLKKHKNGARIVFDPKPLLSMNVCSILTPTGKAFTGTFARNDHQICRNQKVKL